MKPHDENANPIAKEWKNETFTVSNIDVRALSVESGGGSASFDTEVLPQEQVVQEDVYSLADEAYHWCVQGVPPSDQCSFSISTTETVGEVVPNDCKVDGASDDQETYRVVEETPRSSATQAEMKRFATIVASAMGYATYDGEWIVGDYPISLESKRLLNEQTGNKWLDK
ncbi:MAG: hypothetical protein ACW99G_12040 [Candidatus Thorarchaeota archaeon]|jgi:hypothetical protein